MSWLDQLYSDDDGCGDEDDEDEEAASVSCLY